MSRPDTRLVIIWLALIALTLLSFGAGESHLRDGAPVFAVVIVAALVKVRFVILDFMEVRSASWLLRLVLEGWIVALAAVLLILFD
jgi:caa(3)-type oxidase subunit IV